MAIIMGIIAVIRLTKVVPKKLTEAALHSNQSAAYYNASTLVKAGHHRKLAAPVVSSNEHIVLMKRMAELEEKVNAISTKPPMPPEKEQMLNAALTRVSALEHELNDAKLVYIPFSDLQFISLPLKVNNTL